MKPQPGTPLHNDLLGLFANHRVAPNLLMVIMFLLGGFALTKLNTQFFPTFELEYVSVRTVWSGGSPEDVESAITTPIEQELRTLNNLKNMTSTSAQGVSVITLEYNEGTDMGSALDQVEEKISAVRNLPSDAEPTTASRLFRRESISRVLVTGPAKLAELRPLVRRFERELLDRGIASVDITGLPEEEIAVEIPIDRLQDMGMTLADVGEQLSANSRDIPAGVVGRDDVARQLRTLEQRRNEREFGEALVRAGIDGERVMLSDIAHIERRPRDNQTRLFYNGQPAIELHPKRDEASDTLDSARAVQEWVDDTQPTLPPGVKLVVFDEQWSLLDDRIDLILTNGLGGLLLVVSILFLFLNGRVAFWVTAGIPISFMATLAILYAVGGSINMISLFGMIMALGIIVDDAIVVGEEGLSRHTHGVNPLHAGEDAARRMLAPVFSSSLTTIAAFLPLLTVSGIIGNILFDIPLIVICAIIASLVECFLILPGHLQHSFKRGADKESSRFRRRFDAGFERFRDTHFRKLVTLAVEYRGVTLSLIIGALMLAVGLVAGGRIGFTFFPSIEGNIIYGNVAFVAGTPEDRVDAFMKRVGDALERTDEHFGGVVRTSVMREGLAVVADGRSTTKGPQYGSYQIELLPSDHRDVRNEDFNAYWEEQIGALPAGIERFTFSSPRGGPPGRDLEVRLSNAPPERLKSAALELQEALKAIPGVSAIEDDMPYGPPQLIFELTPQGEALGLTAAAVASQLRAAYDGHLAQIYTDGPEELEVRVRLPDAQRHRLSSLGDFALILPTTDRADGSGTVPLATVAEFRDRQGFEILRHASAVRAVNIFADVDRRKNNANDIREELGKELLPLLASKYGLEYSYEGRAADQRETLSDIRSGAIVAVVLIYLVLAWVFSSYGWPLVVMAAIPFGIVGAIVGHWLLGIELTILSLFGVFGLSGIVVNDSIILVVVFKQLRQQGEDVREAIIDAARLRLRAVLLTSLTTIAGLTPLLFESSLQAQFLIPMATTIAFGLAFATVLVLLAIPALLSIHEDVVAWFSRKSGHLDKPVMELEP
ncbi:MAG: efflux RND transporter permease subunit [Gammaproteobacteria bacterium]